LDVIQGKGLWWIHAKGAKQIGKKRLAPLGKVKMKEKGDLLLPGGEGRERRGVSPKNQKRLNRRPKRNIGLL